MNVGLFLCINAIKKVIMMVCLSQIILFLLEIYLQNLE